MEFLLTWVIRFFKGAGIVTLSDAEKAALAGALEPLLLMGISSKFNGVAILPSLSVIGNDKDAENRQNLYNKMSYSTTVTPELRTR